MNTVSLRPDCAQCAALCCVGLAFDRSALFAFDKPAGEVCRNLTSRGRCGIHAELDACGFGGCSSFDCLGAGQYVTQEVFGGRTWRDEPSLLGPMMAAFSALREVHELLLLLRQARALPLPASVRAALEGVETGLAPAAGWTAEDVSSGAIGAAVEDARAFLRSLRAFARREDCVDGAGAVSSP